MLLLGAYHGINPGMGWLFAVALGMQERKGSAVARALVPIALGHALSIGVFRERTNSDHRRADDAGVIAWRLESPV